MQFAETVECNQCRAKSFPAAETCAVRQRASCTHNWATAANQQLSLVILFECQSYLARRLSSLSLSQEEGVLHSGGSFHVWHFPCKSQSAVRQPCPRKRFHWSCALNTCYCQANLYAAQQVSSFTHFSVVAPTWAQGSGCPGGVVEPPPPDVGWGKRDALDKSHFIRKTETNNHLQSHKHIQTI